MLKTMYNLFDESPAKRNRKHNRNMTGSDVMLLSFCGHKQAEARKFQGTKSNMEFSSIALTVIHDFYIFALYILLIKVVQILVKGAVDLYTIKI